MILDGFHGAGGWAEGLKMLGRAGVGVEYDPDMVATAEAAGHACLLGDVAAVDPRELLGGERCEGVIMSPVCPSFSAAGKQLGRKDLPALHWLIEELAAGRDSRDQVQMHDERSILTVEPMRWVTLTLPEWVALEQVPAVLPVWEDMAARLRAHHGYSTWTGIVYAEQYGVPQTRQRAVLLASRTRDVSAGPTPTHRRYYPPGHKYSVSGNGDGHLPRWVSMAQALGWPEEWVVNTRADRKTPGGNEFSPERPSWALTEKTRSWTVKTGNFTAVARDEDGRRTREGSVPYERDIDHPAPTVTGNANRWIMQGDIAAQARNSGPGARRTPRPVDSAPSYTIRAQGSGMHPSGVEWTTMRPATTVSGDPRISGPGHKDGRPGSGYPRQQENAIRVSLQEAAVLQSFRPDYPFQGTRTKQFMQCGNAVPPMLAKALLESVI